MTRTGLQRRLAWFECVLHAILIPVLVAGGCYDPDLSGDGFFRCSDGACPDGFSCSPASVCVPEGSSVAGCTAGTPAQVGVDLSTAIGLALDRPQRRLHASFGGGPPQAFVFVASRDLPDGEWTLETYGRRVIEESKLGFTAIDALGGEIALVFDDALSAPQTGLQDARAVVYATEPRRGGALLELPYGAGSGAFLDVALLSDRRNAALVYRSDDRAHVASIDHETRKVSSAQPVAIALPGDAPPHAGQYNRILVREGGERGPLVDVAFLARSDDGADDAFSSTQAFLASRTGNQPFGEARAVGRLSVRLPAAAHGLDLVDDEGRLHMVWTETSGNGYALHYRRDSDAPEEVRPGGTAPSTAGAPALAALGGRLGLAFIDEAGVLYVTARNGADANTPWLPALAIEDTRTAGALQAKLVAASGSAEALVLELAYANRDRALRHRTVTCAFR